MTLFNSRWTFLYHSHTKPTISFTGSDMTTEQIVDRIIHHRLEYENRNKRKEKKELEAYEAFQKAKEAEKAG